MFKDVDELKKQIKAFGLERHEEKLIALAKPAIRMLPTRVEEDEIPIGASKLGGNPDLPADFEWKYYDGKPMTFIGQFKLSELAPYDRDKELPAKGMLYFFCDIESVAEAFGTWHLEYLEDEAAEIRRRIHPKGKAVYRMIDALPSHRLSFESILSLPIIYSDEAADYGLDFMEDEHEQYWEFFNTSFPEPWHSFLGYAAYIQYYPEWTCVQMTKGHEIQKIREQNGKAHSNEEFEFIKSEMKHWKFLFQLDTDDSLNVMWGDAGNIYICLLKSRLEKKEFHKAITLMQCS